MTTKPLFQPGTSGNPAGRKRGIPDRRTSVRALVGPHVMTLARAELDKALGGDSLAVQAVAALCQLEAQQP